MTDKSSPRLWPWLVVSAWMAAVSTFAFWLHDGSTIGIMMGLAAILGVAVYVIESRHRGRRDD